MKSWETEAYPPTSKLVETEALPDTRRAREEALKVFWALQVLVWDLLATPLAPQLILTKPLEAVLDKAKELASKEIEAMWTEVPVIVPKESPLAAREVWAVF